MASKEARTRVKGSVLVDQVRQSPVDRSLLATRRWILVGVLVLLAVLAVVRWSAAQAETVDVVAMAGDSGNASWSHSDQRQVEKRA